MLSRTGLSWRKGPGNIWYICFQGSEPGQLAERYDYEEAFQFHYMYYDFVIYKLTHK